MNKKPVYTVEEIKRKMERYCVYQDRCHKEVEDKLREYKLIPQAREAILLHLLEHNFLNEERFAKSFARGKFRIKKWGRIRIVRELKFRHISEYNIKTALKEIDEDTYMNNLYGLAEKKNNLIKDTNNYERKRKLYAYLNYRGYETSLIQEVIETYTK
ncbi:regulatory protein RecX [Tenacibaculum sp. 190524A05c]|uniref:Regulatory protein RecX n=1 Tax=Tenacibaculum platacis TaxID=3137852 RepID=A0ABP1ES19_9FLAO